MRPLAALGNHDDLATDEEEVSAHLEGDPEAFERLVDRHQRSLLHVLRRLTGDADDARDLFQETLLQAYRSLAQLREPGAFKGWLLQIAVRKARRLRDHRQLPGANRDSLLEDRPDPRAATRETVEAADEHALVQRQLEQLPPRQREVVVLRHYRGCSFAEIGTILGIQEDAARANHYQGLRRLRRALAPPPGDQAREEST